MGFCLRLTNVHAYHFSRFWFERFVGLWVVVGEEILTHSLLKGYQDELSFSEIQGDLPDNATRGGRPKQHSGLQNHPPIRQAYGLVSPLVPILMLALGCCILRLVSLNGKYFEGYVSAKRECVYRAASSSMHRQALALGHRGMDLRAH